MFIKVFQTNFKYLLLRNLKCKLCKRNQASQFISNPCTFLSVRTLSHTSAGFHISKKPIVESNTNNEKLYALTHNDPDTFGSQSTYHISDNCLDEGDQQEKLYTEQLPKPSQKLRTKEYANIIKDHLRNKRIKEAIDVVEIRMIKEDRVKPENYIFNLLIGGCAQVGYSKKAFSLYNKMKQRGLKVTGGTYTSLFNACATTPWQQDGLNKANHLREIMLEKQYEPNESNYNAMIKAYGRCGDIQTAFQLVDEMKDKHLNIEVKTFNFLLQACASDKEHGFRHALLVWHKIFNHNLIPDLFSFNLMLRCVRDCNIGDLQTMNEVVKQILFQSKSRYEFERKRLGLDGIGVPKITESVKDYVSINSVDINNENVNVIKKTEVNSPDRSAENQTNPEITNPISVDEAPNLLSKYSHLGSLVSLSEITKPEDRLLLIGGASGFVRTMEENKVKGNIKTFTELLEVIPSTNSAEKFIITNVQKNCIKCDIDFLNILMKKRSMRFDYEGAKAVLRMIKIASLQPDIITYGILALGCCTPEEARQLLQEMYDNGLRMNIQILGAMLKQGCVQYNFDYVEEIMNIVQTERIKPNEEFLTHLYQFNRYCAIKIRNNKQPTENENFLNDFRNFKKKLTNWRKHMGFENLKLNEAIKVVQEHPWEQFNHTQSSGIEEIKNPKSRLKKKLTRHIQQIKPNLMIGASAAESKISA